MIHTHHRAIYQFLRIIFEYQNLQPTADDLETPQRAAREQPQLMIVSINIHAY